MTFDPNELFYEMVLIYKENYTPDNKVVICNEGSSRSSKTWDFFHFLYMYYDHNRNKNLDCYCLRETLSNCRDFTFKEFKDCFKKMGVWDDSKCRTSPKPDYKLFGNNIFFRGLDDSSEGYPSDILFINEALENQNKSKVDGLKMRCRKLIVLDWNPKYTVHWCFDLEGQPNTFFTHSTYKNNKHLEGSIIKEIEGYCPWHFEDLELKKENRRPNIENIKNGTDDEYRWLVYGEGIRAAPEGQIHKNVTYIDEFPDTDYWYATDFGFTNDPTTIVKTTVTGKNIYYELLCYQPTATPEILDLYMTKRGIEKYKPNIADSSDKYSNEHGTVEMVKDLKKKGWKISKVSKIKNNFFWITKMNEYKIHIVINDLSHFAKKEQQNYTWMEINGMVINKPIDKHDHFWNAAKYGFMQIFTNSLQPNKDWF